MTVALTLTWDPRGEGPRLARLMPLLRELYSAFIVVVPPNCDAATLNLLDSLGDVQTFKVDNWREGRYWALNAALETEAAHVHYVDLDRLVRWAETRPDELTRIVAQLQRADYLVIGRTAAAQATHPQCLQATERITNRLISHWVGQELDLPSGSKGFSRRAAEFLLANVVRDTALGTDAEWAVLLHRGGFTLMPVEVDGLDWETADRYLDRAADAETQQRAAAAYDADPVNWAVRVQVADETVQIGLDALTRPLKGN